MPIVDSKLKPRLKESMIEKHHHFVALVTQLRETEVSDLSISPKSVPLEGPTTKDHSMPSSKESVFTIERTNLHLGVEVKVQRRRIE